MSSVGISVSVMWRLGPSHAFNMPALPSPFPSDNKVLCACYKLPNSLPHQPIIMEGTELGEPVLTDIDRPQVGGGEGKTYCSGRAHPSPSSPHPHRLAPVCGTSAAHPSPSLPLI